MITRRIAIARLLLAGIALYATFAQSADVFPGRPIRIIVPAAPGGTTDIAARALADRMGSELGQPIVVENRAGAAGIIGVQAFLAATPDGYTILMGNIGPNAINYALYKNLSYKPEDMIPITTVISNPSSLPSTMGFIRGGRLRPLAVTGKQRAPELPEVPTMAEAGYPDFEVTGWFGLFASARTPSAAIDRIYRAAKIVLASPEIRARFAELGGTAGGEPPEQFQRYVMAEKQKWAQVAAAAKIQPE